MAREYRDLGELGMERSVKKFKGAKKWERKNSERETHVKCSSKKPRVTYYDEEDYEYSY